MNRGIINKIKVIILIVLLLVFIGSMLYGALSGPSEKTEKSPSPSVPATEGSAPNDPSQRVVALSSPLEKI